MSAPSMLYATNRCILELLSDFAPGDGASNHRHPRPPTLFSYMGSAPVLLVSQRHLDDSYPFFERPGGPIVIHPKSAFIVRVGRAAKPVEPALAGNPHQGHVEFFDHEFSPRREI